MKVAVIADTHFGVRSDSLIFDEHIEQFFTDQFVPYLLKHKIKHVIHLGDVFDRRKQVNINILDRCRRYFFDPITHAGIRITTLVGNHDTFYKNSNAVNSVELLLRDYDNIHVIAQEAEEFVIGDRSILMVPWICDDNAASIADAITATTSAVCFGHFEIAGFAMYRGMTNTDGLNPSTFDKFTLTCSGHFHHRNSADTIFYLGSPYQMTWSDAGDARGFHVFDTKTLQMEFIENERQMFHKILYDEPCDINVKSLVGTYVKLVVVNKTDFTAFDETVEALNKVVADLKIIEDFSEFEADALDDDAVEVEDTMTMLGGYVDSIETDADKARVKSLLHTLYVEAQHLE